MRTAATITNRGRHGRRRRNRTAGRRDLEDLRRLAPPADRHLDLRREQRVDSAIEVALDLWNGFPVQATPRPIVPLGEGVVLDPRTGFPDDSTKIAFGEGRFALERRYPRARERSGASRHAAPTTCCAPRDDQVGCRWRREDPRGASRYGDVRHRWGRRRLPAWQFWFKRVAKPASVLALAPPDLFTPPGLQELGPPGTGNSIEDSARVDRSGRVITISFIGAHAGNRPCDASYSARAVAGRRAVAFTIRTVMAPAPPNTICPAVGSPGRRSFTSISRSAHASSSRDGRWRDPCHLGRPARYLAICGVVHLEALVCRIARP